MKKYKLLRHSQCYINRAGDFIICLLKGNKDKGYLFAGSHANPPVILGTFSLLSRIVPYDGNWMEIDHEQFNLASSHFVYGNTVAFPPSKTGRDMILRKFIPSNL